MTKERMPISFMIHDAMKGQDDTDPADIALSVLDSIDPADRRAYLADMIRQRVSLIRGYRGARI